MNAIGHIRSEFRQKFGVPKQPGLAPALKAVITLKSEWAHESALRGLEECSHLWVIFQFHMNAAFSGATVRPPLLGGEKRMGVFATRSPHRPNPLGLSLVKIESVEIVDGEAQIQVSGHDFVDGTPVLDLKPFVSSYDVPHDKSFHWSDHVKTTALPVQWTERARQVSGDKVEAITQVLQLDPRPRNAKAESRFGLSFAGLNVVFVWNGAELLVEEVTPESASSHIK
jgi:tRNA-Thr(GGU) m(6)t(6)A37 methyltransferase TsaA